MPDDVGEALDDAASVSSSSSSDIESLPDAAPSGDEGPEQEGGDDLEEPDASETEGGDSDIERAFGPFL